MVAAKDQPQRLQLSSPGLHNAQGELLAQPQRTLPPHSLQQSSHIPLRINPLIKKHSNISSPTTAAAPTNLERFSRFAKRQGFNTNQSNKESTVATDHKQQLASNFNTTTNSSGQEKPPNSFSRSKVKSARIHQNMELHDASGTVLHQYPLNGDADSQQHQDQQHPQVAPQQGKQEQQVQHSDQSQPQQPQTTHVQGQHQTGTNTTATTTAGAANVAAGAVVSGTQQATTQTAIPKKPARMPGTKQCPTCHNTIAAAVAKCPKCPHVFREKKEKVKRSGKRGKKNCPKCQHENPSACSSCKQCKYVFRLKLMDKYKAMRPRQQSNESAVAAAAAAAHAAANMQHAGQGGAVTAVSTVPLPAGVATYPSQMAQQIHPGHAAVSVMPPMQQHPITMHQHGHNVHNIHNVHNVHPTSVPMHPMPQHSIHPHQPHPQL